MKMLDKFDMYETEHETSIDSPVAKVFERSPDTFGAADSFVGYNMISESDKEVKSLFENSIIKIEDS